MIMNKQIRAGILRMSGVFMTEVFSDFITGKKKLVNKKLALRGITRLNDDVPFLSCAYDFVFIADDLPVLPEGCNPTPDLKIEEVKGKKDCYKLVSI